MCDHFRGNINAARLFFQSAHGEAYLSSTILVFGVLLCQCGRGCVIIFLGGVPGGGLAMIGDDRVMRLEGSGLVAKKIFGYAA